MAENSSVFRAFLSKEEPNKELEKLYYAYREMFLGFIRKSFAVDESLILDIYQEAFAISALQIQKGDLNPDNLSVSFKTYLFSIGRNRLSNYIRNNGRLTGMSDHLNNRPIITDENKETWRIVREEVQSMGNPCNEVLSLFYFERKNFKNIAEMMGYKTEQVAKNKKLSCMKILKESILKKYKRGDLL